MKENWNTKVGSPYSSWDTNQMQSYLSDKGYQAKQGTKETKDGLLSQMKKYWYETEDQASDSYHSVKDWIFDRYACSVSPNKNLANQLQLDRVTAQGILGLPWHSQPATPQPRLPSQGRSRELPVCCQQDWRDCCLPW